MNSNELLNVTTVNNTRVKNLNKYFINILFLIKLLKM